MSYFNKKTHNMLIKTLKFKNNAICDVVKSEVKTSARF